jgi:hypothetical protein
VTPLRWRITRDLAAPFGGRHGWAWRIEASDSTCGWEIVARRPSQARAILFIDVQRRLAQARVDRMLS